MYQFFVEDTQVGESSVTIEGSDVNHIRNVLRMKCGEKVRISTQSGRNYFCEVAEITEAMVCADILEECAEGTELPNKIYLFQGLPKNDKMELIIQKGTELGVHSFVPVAFKRSIVKLDEKDKVKKQIRWQKIAEVAAKQSGRDIVPKVHEVKTIKNVCDLINEYDVVLVAYENEDKNSLKNELNLIKQGDVKIAVVIGPEGGIEETEVQELKNAGAKIVSLGKRILRTETVAIVVAGIINYELESTEDE